MTISYNWLCEYLPIQPEPEKLSKILTSIGLEVESLEPYEALKGGLKGLVIGEVLTCSKHPDADKLSITQVNTGQAEPLQIVCGAANVAAGQKVVVANIGATIYPVKGEPITMKKAKIRGVESHGMICAEDEIGLSDNHDGILVLPADAQPGMPAAEYFKPYADFVFEIGLTPNRMDAMSHLGVARDVCAWLSQHQKKDTQVKLPFKNTPNSKTVAKPCPVSVSIANAADCQRYAGVLIENVTVTDSPDWLKNRLKSIGLKPINNLVDITNFILHETGQPLHAFDADKIGGQKIVVQNLPAGTAFTTLDDKERKLDAADLMICDENSPLCIAGVYGGLQSGVTSATKNIFLESAWFSPGTIRKTSLRHGLRTDAATRFEKGVDISHTVTVLKRAATLIAELGGGIIQTDIIDVYPNPQPKTEIALKFHYLKKLSGKNYHGDTVKNILTSLGFEIIKEGHDDIWLKVPYSKPDITLPADLVEEIMRIDGLDNVEIPAVISIAPAVENNSAAARLKEKIAGSLAGIGFNEIFTNSITNSAYYSEAELASTVKMMNSLSAELNVMRPAMLQTGLESVAYNMNRKNNHLRFFEFGRTYQTSGIGQYTEAEHLSIFVTGNKTADHWKAKADKTDIYYVKAICEKLALLCGAKNIAIKEISHDYLVHALQLSVQQQTIGVLGMVNKTEAARFDLKQPIFYADLYWDAMLQIQQRAKTDFKEIPRFPQVQRDLAIVVDESISYAAIEKATAAARIHKLTSMNLFDIFESEKLGRGKKSMAINFTFLDEEKTMTDKEIDSMMAKITSSFEKELNAEIRK
jgi:phenylalanyl-tRNA synthetase beta chain